MRKTIIITGASSGLGAEMARQFAAKGHDLGLCARRTERLESLKSEIEAAHPEVNVVLKALDVNDHDAVFSVFQDFRQTFGSIDRVIVNAGMGKGGSLGTGLFKYNKMTAETNFVAALAQCEAALEIFREQNHGHLVTIASISALRGMPRAMTTYAATKAALLNLTEGIRADMIRSGLPIAVSCILPGFIRSEINEKVKNTPFMCDTVPGVRSMVNAIDKEKAVAFVPGWPWRFIAFLMKRLPLKVVMKMG
ncbi:MAG: SDR family oxidoreductase [Aliidiomarina sp.]|uniref:SDR family oxidoreductase n=1 Tax=Aliidiomarina sp. TaxID=1872439 RepID=UPI0025C7207D|nr:SDR family oxidoreductase [Aliidiomarina sp.]MCH8502019.1 SDR family oxidoreductase [Aliidiomarina sp.]